ncbi:YebC/PmpR family DNA-binding transcriptional regulator [Thermorudis peleae]|uniref:YebC/PmpR family DNA-binding transcriptional regulator n=1 Tax=Thermorudis peleae TaxID=1382356 RepID=UPI0005704BA7|nr:YebC/PmpR family DNA-binding transcriptional regulator [Thermorudis peleae]
MAGHSKWAQIKRQKAVADFRKGQIFSKLSREIQVAVREGGPNPDANPRLRMAIERARREGMPKENIENAIAKATGAAGGGNQYETIVYEGYGPGGIAIMAIALTDNRNRTASEVRHTFSRYGGSLGETGSVAWQFDTVGQIVVPLDGRDPDEVGLLAIDAGARDVEVEDETLIITTDPEVLSDVVEKLQAAGLTIRQADIQRVPQTTVELEGAQAQSALKLLEALEDLDDIQEVYTNASFPAEVPTAS